MENGVSRPFDKILNRHKFKFRLRIFPAASNKLKRRKE